MKEYLINECSLQGQFSSENAFFEGLTVMSKLLKLIISYKGILLKNHSLMNTPAVGDQTVGQVICQHGNDRARRFKSILSFFARKPFWDDNQKQKLASNYYSGRVANGTSIAEAYVRGASLVSFTGSIYGEPQIKILVNGKKGTIDNFVTSSNWIKTLTLRRELPFNEFLRAYEFLKLGLADWYKYETVDHLSAREFKEVIESLLSFDQKTWNDIKVDDALDFKPYRRTSSTKDYFPNEIWNRDVWKFRISRRDRCFGCLDNGVFKILTFDFTHKMSD